MRIFAYSIKDNELPALKQWQQNNPLIEVAYTKYDLTTDSAMLSEGANGVVIFQDAEVSRDSLEVLHKRGIRNISTRGFQTNNLNLTDLKDLGFHLTIVPESCFEGIAEHAIFLMGSLLHQINSSVQRTYNGDFTRPSNAGKNLSDQTVGIIGTGAISQMIVKILSGFDTQTLLLDPNNPKEVDKFYSQSDIICLQTQSNTQNYHLINQTTINKMKTGVYIINCSDGDLLDTNALITGLDNGKIAGAGLDTVENQNFVFGKTWSTSQHLPDSNIKSLLQKPNVTITPHSAFDTQATISKMISSAFDSNKKLIMGQVSSSEIF